MLYMINKIFYLLLLLSFIILSILLILSNIFFLGQNSDMCISDIFPCCALWQVIVFYVYSHRDHGDHGEKRKKRKKSEVFGQYMKRICKSCVFWLTPSVPLSTGVKRGKDYVHHSLSFQS